MTRQQRRAMERRGTTPELEANEAVTMATDLLGKSLATIALLRGVDFALGVLDQARDQLKLQAQVHQVEDIAEARRSTKNCN